MSRRPPRILFIGHDATRTGAPLILLNFLRWFAREVRWPFRIVLLRGGDLHRDFQELAPTTCLEDGFWGTLSPVRSALRRAGCGPIGIAAQRAAMSLRSGPEPDLIYCNSVAAAPSLAIIRQGRIPFVSHIHELEFSFTVTVPRADVDELIRRTDRYIACAAAVRDYLVHQESVSPDRIEVVHEFLVPHASLERSDADVRSLLKIPPEVPIVGSVGTLDWRKGPDLFVQVAARLLEANPARGAHFLWVGSGTHEEIGRVRHDIRRAGLEAHVTILGPVADPKPLYAAIDVFVSTSREDPFPLVCLEAASAGKPIVCFDGAGGMPEFVEADAGFIVPYLNVPAMAASIGRLLDDPSLRSGMGDAAKRKALSRHSLESTAPRILMAIERTLGARKPLTP